MWSWLKELAVTKLFDPFVGSLPHSAQVYLANHSLKTHAARNLWELGLNGREALSRAYLRGNGIEIGALNSPLPLGDLAQVRYVDCVTTDVLRERHPDLEFKAPDIVDDGATLATIPDGILDFVIACHVIEHVEDPIGAMQTWLRVLKQGGILFLSIPDRRFTFDFYRPVTTWEHLRLDHEEGPERSRADHFEEVFRQVVGVEDGETIRHLYSETMDRDTHFHVWTQVEMLELIVELRRYGLDFEIEAFCAHGNESTFVLRKGARQDRDGALQSLKQAREEFELNLASGRITIR